MDDWSPQFNSLLSSPLGAELQRTAIEDLHNSIIQDAEQTNDPSKAFGLLKQASGVMLMLNHLKSRAVVTPTDEGGKVKK